MKTFFCIVLFTLFSLNFSKAYAYLDPGTGGIIIQAILGFIAAVIAYFSFYFNKVKSLRFHSSQLSILTS